MKKQILTALLTLNYMVCLFGQNVNLPSRALEVNYNERFYFGVKIGANFPRLYYTNKNISDLPHDFMVRLSTGIFAEIPFSDRLALAPELNYQQRGGSTSYLYEQIYDINYSLKADYVSVRLPIITYSNLLNNFKPYLLLGPDIGYVIDGEISLSQTGLDIPESKVGINTSNINYVYAGIIGGAGVRLNLPFQIITLVIKIDAAINMGFTDTFSTAEHSETATPTNIHAYNHQGKRLSRGFEVNLSIGYIPDKKDDVCDHFMFYRTRKVRLE